MRAMDATGSIARVSETSLRGVAGLTGFQRLWVELAVRSLGLHEEPAVRLRDVQPSWGRIAVLLFESGQPF